MRTLPAIFFVSGAAIAWQIALMRCLLIARYHHFSFLVISCALLGFGAGGALLSLGRDWFLKRVQSVFQWGLLGYGISMPLCFHVGDSLAVEVYFSPLLLGSTLGWWFLFWIIHVIPFLIAGTLIGLALMNERKRVNRVYACNLVGSAAGAAAIIIAMDRIPAQVLVLPIALSVIVSGLFLGSAASRVHTWAYRGCLIVAGTFVLAGLLSAQDREIPLTIDQHKTLAYVERLRKQGDARRLATLHGMRGRIDLYSSPHFHTLASLSTTDRPPPMDIILRDGFRAGSILNLKDPSQARVLERTLWALPYQLVRPDRILVLGDSGGVHVWLARLSPAKTIVVVHPDENVLSVLRGHGSDVLNDPRVQLVVAEPRAFLDRTKQTFDIIHLVQLEGFTAGSGGIGGLREDYLATRQGFAQCLKRLSPSGLACVVRGIQQPFRDNVKIAATWIEALEGAGVKQPGNRIFAARDELNLATLVSGSDLTSETIAKFESVCDDRSWDMEWFPGIGPQQTNRIHLLPGPRGADVSWYHHALLALLSPLREQLYDEWVGYIRPAVDDRPFFYDFFKWSSIETLRALFGPMWPARAEMGFLLLVMALVWAVVVAFLVLPLPVLISRKTEGLGSVRASLIGPLFGALGMGFMFLEMGFIQMFTRFLGDPILAAALIVGGFLFFAGLGSFFQPRITGPSAGRTLVISLLIAVVAIVCSAALPMVFGAIGLLGLPQKAAMSLLMIAPMTFLMGLPFPWALSRLHRRTPQAVPLAWSVNGFASVVSSSAAVVIAMSYGFSVLLAIAAMLYAVAGVLAFSFDRTGPA